MLRQIPLSLLSLILALLVSFSAVYSITVGPMTISVSDSLKSLLLNSTDVASHIQIVIHQVRFPRTVLCMLVGAILALCGTVMQGLFRNPLAEPGIIGVSAGAMLGAAIAIVLVGQLDIDAAWLNSLSLPLFAFVGGTVTTLLVYRLGTSSLGTSVTMMLLAGVAISALSGAGVGYLNFVADDQMLRDLSLWSMGSFAGANWTSIALCAVILALLLGYFSRHTLALNALLLGESEARHLGIGVERLKYSLIFLSALGVGVTVSAVGMIGFVGLIVPHLGRILVGPDHRNLLPVSALLGALLLTIADMISRQIIAPAELPIGIVTAFVGAPFFLYLLFQQKGKLF